MAERLQAGPDALQPRACRRESAEITSDTRRRKPTPKTIVRETNRSLSTVIQPALA